MLRSCLTCGHGAWSHGRDGCTVHHSGKDMCPCGEWRPERDRTMAEQRRINDRYPGAARASLSIGVPPMAPGEFAQVDPGDGPHRDPCSVCDHQRSEHISDQGLCLVGSAEEGCACDRFTEPTVADAVGWMSKRLAGLAQAKQWAVQSQGSHYWVVWGGDIKATEVPHFKIERVQGYVYGLAHFSTFEGAREYVATMLDAWCEIVRNKGLAEFMAQGSGHYRLEE